MDFSKIQENLAAFKMFIDLCNEQPQLLHLPQLEFFRKFIIKLGGTIPSAPKESAKSKPETAAPSASEPKQEEKFESEEEEESDSEPELDTEGCVSPDHDEPLNMGDPDKEVTEDEISQADDLRSKAASAFSEQKFDEAIALYTQAIELNPGSAPYFTKRAQALLKLSKPNASVKDCNKALEINCDSAAAYKFRGKANRLLGNWESAASDLRQACKLDFDEEADEWLREVTPNAKKLEQYKLKQAKKAKKTKTPEKTASSSAMPEDMFSSLGDMFGDFNDPELMAAFLDITKNPSNLSKYKNNPKFMKLFESLNKATGDQMNMKGKGGVPKTKLQEDDLD